MNDHYAIAHTAMRLSELRAEAAQERLATAVRTARRGWNRTATVRPMSARATAGGPIGAACCA